MKKILLLICFGLMCTMGVQSQSWAPMGAIWYYNVVDPFGPGITYTRYEVTGDTVIQDKNCSIITGDMSVWESFPGNLDCIYTYEENGKVYIWDPFASQFCLMYDFSLVAGQSYQTSWNGCQSENTISATGTQTINGISLSTYTLAGSSTEFVHYIGEMSSLFPYNFNYCDTIMYDGPFIQGLRCYDDPVIGHYETGLAPYCDYVLGIENPEKETLIRLSPNPGSNTLYIQTSLKDAKFELYDITGRQVMKRSINKVNTTINTSALLPGMYFYRFTLNGEVKESGKWVKE